MGLDVVYNVLESSTVADTVATYHLRTDLRQKPYQCESVAANLHNYIPIDF